MAAAGALTGRNVWVGVGKQSAINVGAAPTKFYEVTDISGIMEEYDWKKSDRRVGSRWKGVGYKTTKKVPISFTVEVNAQNAGLLCTLAMGSDVAAADGAAYSHTISLADELPYFTFWASTDSVADNGSDATIHQVMNCKVISMKIDAVTDDVLKMTIEAVGTSRAFCFSSKTGISGTNTSGNAAITGITSTAGIVEGATITGSGIPASTTVLSVDSATAITMSANSTENVTSFAIAAPTPTFPTAKSLFVKAEEGVGKLEIGANIGGLAQFDEATEFHLTMSNGVAPDMRIDNTSTAAALREGDSEITGNLKAVYNRNTMVEVEAFQAGTARAIRFTSTSTETAATGKYFSFTFTTDAAAYSGAPTSWDPDVITTDCAFEVPKTTSYPTIIFVNADAAQYD